MKNQNLLMLLSTICLSACASINVPNSSSTREQQTSYRNLSIQESLLREEGAAQATLLLAESTKVDGDVWAGANGIFIALRTGRPTFFQGRQNDGFFAYALFDPVEEWRRKLGSAPSELNVGTETIRYLWRTSSMTPPIVERRLVKKVTKSYGELCDSFATGPCWVIEEQVWFGQSMTNKKSITVIDAISNQVISMNYPLPDGYGDISWQRVR